MAFGAAFRFILPFDPQCPYPHSRTKKTLLPAAFASARASPKAGLVSTLDHTLMIPISGSQRSTPACWAGVSFCECDTLLDRFVSKVADTVHIQSASFHHFVGPGHRYRPSSGSHFRWLCSYILFCGSNCLTLPAEYQKTIGFYTNRKRL